MCVVRRNNNKYDFSFLPGSPATSKCGPPQSRLRHDKVLSYTSHVSMIELVRRKLRRNVSDAP